MKTYNKTINKFLHQYRIQHRFQIRIIKISILHREHQGEILNKLLIRHPPLNLILQTVRLLTPEIRLMIRVLLMKNKNKMIFIQNHLRIQDSLIMKIIILYLEILNRLNRYWKYNKKEEEKKALFTWTKIMFT